MPSSDSSDSGGDGGGGLPERGGDHASPDSPDAPAAEEPPYEPLISPPARVTITQTLKRLDLKGKEYTAYRMEVMRVSGEINTLDQRYQFFHDLNEELDKAELVPAGAELPGKKWFSNFDPNFVEERRQGLQEYLERVLAAPRTQYSAEVERFFDAPGRYDWPSKLGAVDLDVHDCPHLSSEIETWRFRANVTIDGREHGMFAWFSRSVSEVDPDTQKPSYVHAVVSAFVDIEAGTYHAATVLDPHAPAVLRDRLARTTFRDHTIVAAYQEILAKGSLPLPDRLAESPKGGECDPRKLRFVMDGNKLERQSDGSYIVTVRHPSGRGCALVFSPTKPPVRHGETGVVIGDEGEELYSYCVPRCEVSGSFTLDSGGGSPVNVEAGGSPGGWYEHQFGGKPLESTDGSSQGGSVGMTPRGTHIQPRGYAIHACDLQLEGGMDVTVSLTFDMGTGAIVGSSCVVVDDEGERTYYEGDSLLFEGTEIWQSTRTFQEFPTKWHLSVPEAELSLTMSASFADQELITLLSQPSFWEGCVGVSGECAGRHVTGSGFVVRRGFGALCSLEQFFHVVGNVVRTKASLLLPDSPTQKQARKMIGGSASELEGIQLDALDASIVQPIRALTDCGGQAWRSFAMLASCDAVGGDSRALIDWIALPELLHVGTTMVGAGSAATNGAEGGQQVNAGCACFTLAQRLLDRVADIPPPVKLQLYDHYFAALRSGQVGQGLDSEGLMGLLPKVVGDGNVEELEAALLCTYRLKTGAPAAAVAQMGALGGDGEEEHVKALGEFARKTSLGFQLASDVAAVRRGDPSTLRCVTMPVVKALGKCKTRPERQAIVDALRNGGAGSKGDLCSMVEQAGGFPSCMAAAIGACICDPHDISIFREVFWEITCDYRHG